MLGPLAEMTGPAKRTLVTATLFDPMRIKGLSCVLQLSSDQLVAIEEISGCAGLRREAVESEIRQAGESLASSFVADPLDADQVRQASLVVRERDAQMFAELMVGAARVRALLNAEQRCLAVTVPMGMESTPISGIPVW